MLMNDELAFVGDEEFVEVATGQRYEGPIIILVVKDRLHIRANIDARYTLVPPTLPRP